MALQSQTLRGSGSNMRASSSMSSSTRRHGHKRFVGILLLLLVLGAGFLWLKQSREGGPQTARADTPSNAPESEAAASVPKPQPAPQVPAHEPTILQMGTRPPPPGASSSPSPNTSPNTSLVRLPLPAPAATEKPAAAALPPVGQTPSAPTTTQPAPRPDSAAPATVVDPLSGQQPGVVPNDGSGLPGELAAVQALAERAIGAGKLVEARTHLNKILVDPRVSEKDRDGIRRWMADINKDLVFSGAAYPGDPLVETYKVEKGDNLIKISRKVNSVTEAGMIQRVNGVNPSNLRIDQPLKIVKGPFHAVVSKSAFRMDIFAGPTPAPASIGKSSLGAGAEPGWTYIRSFPVGLGEKGGTPLGAFTVRDHSKLINPPWTNPRTGEKFDDDDPNNPIGERWVGLVGLDEHARTFNGYGIHGTIVPESIGREMSMGCVRMNAPDVEIVYDLLMGKVSVVKIVP